MTSCSDQLAKEGVRLEEITSEMEMRLSKAKKLIRAVRLLALRVAKTSQRLVEGLAEVIDFYTSQFITAHG